MRTISGTLKPTNTDWLPVICNIAPPEIHRENVSSKLLDSVCWIPDLLLLNDIKHHPQYRLTSRKPIWTNSPAANYSMVENWKSRWNKTTAPNKNIMKDPTTPLNGMDLRRDLWCNLNRFRCGTGPCRYMLHKWGYSDSPKCDCGVDQTMQHILQECPETQFHGGLSELHEVTEVAVDWLRNNSIW
jgi:hypothetical protein